MIEFKFCTRCEERVAEYRSGLCRKCYDRDRHSRSDVRAKRQANRTALSQAGLCVDCSKPLEGGTRKRCQSCLALYSIRNKKSKLDKKIAVFEHYGGSPPRCACCGEAEILFLTIDHINGGGNKHRMQVIEHFYSYLAREGFPPGFQVLCNNCNRGRWLNGGTCPHKCVSTLPV